jgi:uncharacterized protein YbgA (DUF1722 family)/uncharacterized protein YbbK (DUF523 family)
METIRIGVSSCLMGNEVRYDGGHKHNRYLTDVLGEHFELVVVCPEAEVGMGIPRETVRLEGDLEAPSMIAPRSGADWTRRMNSYARQRCIELAREDLSGFVFKKRSPSCGLFRVPVVQKNGHPLAQGRGLFAAEFARRFPLVPCEEEGRLSDPHLRENFIERIFARNRWRTLVRGGLSRKRLVEFHTAHKLLLRAHNEAAYQRLGRLVGSAGTVPDAELFRAYELEFQGALRTKANRKRHTNVMQHAMGYFKGHLSGREKAALLASIEDYRLGLLPLVVPLSLLRYEIQRHEVSYLAGQLYFDPNPKELMLRNHV